MPKASTKNHRYALRLNLETYKRLRMIALQLHTPLPDLLVTGALMVYARATNPSQYYAMKAELFAEDPPASPHTPI